VINLSANVVVKGDAKARSFRGNISIKFRCKMEQLSLYEPLILQSVCSAELL